MSENKLRTLRDTIAFRALGDELRLNILRLLMTKAATLSQLGQALDMHPAKVRYHLKQLESAGLVELVRTRVLRGFVEKYYRATAQAFLISVAILPEAAEQKTILALGSHDMALDLLSEISHEDQKTPELLTLPLGSLNGLIALRQGMGQIAGSHLLDPPSGEYNLTYVRHIFPDQEMKIVTLAHRQQGLMVLPGNPLGIKSLADISRPEVLFVNRKRGSGTRVWLDYQFEQLGIEPEQIDGYDVELNTHLQVAEAVAQRRADTGLGLMAAARKYKLDFIPLFEERYDLVIPVEYYQSTLLAPTLDQMQTASFRKAVETLGGYNAKSTGTEIPVKNH
jgi:molybdate-binding protein/DNA-binding HxlR family transcriptional regulator